MALLITEPTGILLTADGSIDRTTGRARMASGVDGYVRAVHFRMELVRGELFYNLEAGRPYVVRAGLVTKADAILGQKFDLGKAQAAFSEPIRATPGYDAILALDIDFVVLTRRMSVSWKARTIWGNTPSDRFERTL